MYCGLYRRYLFLLAIMSGLEIATRIVSNYKGMKPGDLSPNARLFHDLGIDGDSAEEILAELRDKHQVNFDKFVFSNYFGSEVGAGYRYFLYKLFRRFWKSIDELKPLTVNDLGKAIDNGSFNNSESK